MENNKGKSSSQATGPLFFNRSLTIHSTTPAEENSNSNAPKFHHVKGKVKKLCDLFESTKLASSTTSPKIASLRPSKSISYSSTRNSLNSLIRLPGTEDRIVVYLTSLRGIRRTYEDCYAVKMIFRGFGVWVDERDVSMDAAYKNELLSVLKEKSLSLPQVFIKGKHVGGADVIKSMFEIGELAKILDGFPKRRFGFVCQGCGDARFLPCWNCNGSRKVFDEDEELLKKCLECNENGLIRCSDCCS